MITIVTRWENTQMPAEIEWRMWRQLKAFGGAIRFVFVPVMPEFSNICIDQYDTMKEALETVNGNRVFLEPKGSLGMTDLPPRDEDVAFIFGNTSLSNIQHAKENEAYRIKTPQPGHLYPTNAASVVLAYWCEQ